MEAVPKSLSIREHEEIHHRRSSERQGPPVPLRGHADQRQLPAGFIHQQLAVPSALTSVLSARAQTPCGQVVGDRLGATTALAGAWISTGWGRDGPAPRAEAIRAG